MKKLILSLMAVVVAISAMAQSAETTAKYNEAVEAWGAKNFPVAAAAFEVVIEKGIDEDGAMDVVATAKKNLPTCYYQMGLANAKAKELDAAIVNLTKSAQYAELYDDPVGVNKARTVMGRIYQMQGGTAFNAKDYAAAIPIFEKGVTANPRDTKMSNWLGVCYCETGDMAKGMAIFAKIIEMGATNSRYAADAEQAKSNTELYINNKVAELQGAKDYDGVIAMADELLVANPSNATAAFVRLQAYMDKKDYNKVIADGEAAAAIQTTEEGKSDVYFILAAAYNTKDMKSQAIATFKKVTAGTNAATAQATVKELETPAE